MVANYLSFKFGNLLFFLMGFMASVKAMLFLFSISNFQIQEHFTRVYIKLKIVIKEANKYKRKNGIQNLLYEFFEKQRQIYVKFFFLVIKFCKVLLHYKDFLFFLVISYNLPYFEFLESLPRKIFQSGQR